jgi:chromosome segregation ATPase
MADEPMELNEAMRELASSGKIAKKLLRSFVAVESVFQSAQQAQESVASLERRKVELDKKIAELEASREQLAKRLHDESEQVDRELAELNDSFVTMKQERDADMKLLEEAVQTAQAHLTTVTKELEDKQAAAMHEREEALRAQEVEHRGRMAAMVKEEADITACVDAAKARLQQVRQEIGA